SPVITSPASGAAVPSAVTVTGTGPAGTTVVLVEGTAKVGTGTVASDGSWQAPVRLSDGTHTVSAFAVNAAGSKSGNSPALVLNVDAIAPTVTVTASDPNVFVGDVTMDGSASDNHAVARVQLVVKDLTGAQVTSFDATCATCGATSATWTATSTIDPGIYTVDAISYDAVGNPSLRKTIRIVVL
ncbi:MAG: Ig-like domain-containing protein, partial [Actinobacteria bacterium]|nr:Ig-like domain-containing protein [Actinomycetota bacterium]